MTTYDPAAIRAQIKTLLQTATKIANVYDYNNPSIDGYPAIVFDITNEDSSMLDDTNNLRVITFTVYIMSEVKVIGLDGATTLLDNATKEIVNIIEKRDNDTLSNTVDWVIPAVGSRTQIQSPEGLLIYQQLDIRVNIASTIL